MPYIRELLFDDWNVEHIPGYHVLPEEIREVCYSAPFFSRARQGRLRVIGQTEAGRYLIVILAPQGRGVYYPVTARDASRAERRRYQRWRNR